MEIAKLNAVLEKRFSEKKQRDYYVIVIGLSKNCNKEVFLEPAELELLMLRLGK